MSSLSGDDTSSAITHDKDTASPSNAFEQLRQQPTTVPKHFKQTSKGGPQSPYWNFIHTFDSKTKAKVKYTHICLVCLHIKGDSLWRECLLCETTTATRFYRPLKTLVASDRALSERILADAAHCARVCSWNRSRVPGRTVSAG